MGLVCCYAMFLFALSKIALAVLLALGPLFICLRLFDGSRRFFDAWLMQLANYGFITVLTVLVGTLMLQLLQNYATQTAARGTVQTVDSLDMLLAAVIVLLVLRQIMPIAASLAGGGSLSTMGTLSRSISRVVGMPRQYLTFRSLWNDKGNKANRGNIK